MKKRKAKDVKGGPRQTLCIYMASGFQSPTLNLSIHCATVSRQSQGGYCIWRFHSSLFVSLGKSTHADCRDNLIGPANYCIDHSKTVTFPK